MRRRDGWWFALALVHTACSLPRQFTVRSDGGDAQAPIDVRDVLTAPDAGEAGDAAALDGAPPGDVSSDAPGFDAPLTDVSPDDPGNCPRTSAGHYQMVSVAVGRLVACALDCAHQVWCWGANFHAQLGYSPNAAMFSAMPQKVNVPNGAIAIAMGEFHGCAITTANEVVCWGDNGSGQLGHAADASVNGDLSFKPVDGLIRPVQVAAGRATTCAWDGQGVVCWGDNSHGQVGNGHTGSSGVVPSVAFTNPTGTLVVPIALALGSDFTFAARTEMGVFETASWGDYADGRLGLNASGDISTSQSVTPAMTQVMAGEDFGIGLRDDTGTLTPLCWGSLDGNRCGNTTTGNTSTPLDAGALPMLRRLARSSGADVRHACGIDGNNAVQCWGDNTSGQSGSAAAGTVGPILVNVPGGATDIAVGAYDSCAVTSDSEVYCWGAGGYGALGDATIDQGVDTSDGGEVSFAVSSDPVHVLFPAM